MRDYKFSTYQKTNYRFSKRQLNYWRILPIIFCLVIGLVLFLGNIDVSSNESVKIKKITVSKGDTLWSIAKSNYSTSGDIRRYVYHIKKFNKLATAEIHPGQVLLMPHID